MFSKEQETAVNSIFAAYDKTSCPGCTLGVYQDGQMAFKKGYGMASLELALPNSPQSVYYVA